MVEEYCELVARNVVPASGQQNGARRLVVAKQLLETARELFELARRVSHVFHAVSSMRDRLDVEQIIVLENPKYVVQGIVKPGVSLGDQYACRCSRTQQRTCFFRNLRRGGRWSPARGWSRARDSSALSALLGAECNHFVRNAPSACDCGGQDRVCCVGASFRWTLLFARHASSRGLYSMSNGA